MVVTILVLVQVVIVVVVVRLAVVPSLLDVTVAEGTTARERMTVETVTVITIVVTVATVPAARTTEIVMLRKNVMNPARTAPTEKIAKCLWIPLHLEIMMSLIQLNRGKESSGSRLSTTRELIHLLVLVPFSIRRMEGGSYAKSRSRFYWGCLLIFSSPFRSCVGLISLCVSRFVPTGVGPQFRFSIRCDRCDSVRRTSEQQRRPRRFF